MLSHSGTRAIQPAGCEHCEVSRQTFDLASEAVATLTQLCGTATHRVGIVLGSGWATAAGLLGKPAVEVSFCDLPGFVPPGVGGHPGAVRSVPIGPGDDRLLVLVGRVHLYEGHPLATVVHGVRVAVMAGCSTVILTNAAGGIRAGMTVGQAVLISDHINLTGASPLAGDAPPQPYGSPFVNMVDAYSPRLRALAREVNPLLEEGVYAGMPGPHYETPAEIRYLRTVGADLVGMSTVLEAIAARHLGAEVLGISLVTNLAAGLSPDGPEHGEVLAAGSKSAEDLGLLLRGVVVRIVSGAGLGVAGDRLFGPTPQ